MKIVKKKTIYEPHLYKINETVVLTDDRGVKRYKIRYIPMSSMHICYELFEYNPENDKFEYIESNPFSKDTLKTLSHYDFHITDKFGAEDENDLCKEHIAKNKKNHENFKKVVEQLENEGKLNSLKFWED